MLDLQLKYIYEALEEKNNNNTTQKICNNLSYIFGAYMDNPIIAEKLIELWNYTRFTRNKQYSLSLARGQDYKQNCMILFTDNIFYYSKLSNCKNFDYLKKGTLCKALIKFLQDDIFGIKKEIQELFDNRAFDNKEKDKLVRTMYCLIDILDNNQTSFKDNIEYTLMIDKEYRRGTNIKYGLIATMIVRLARYKNRNWLINNKLINKFLVEREFYSQTPKKWSKSYFKKELSEIIELIKKDNPDVIINQESKTNNIFKYMLYIIAMFIIILGILLSYYIYIVYR